MELACSSAIGAIIFFFVHLEVLIFSPLGIRIFYVVHHFLFNDDYAMIVAPEREKKRKSLSFSYLLSNRTY
jgi:hypothetical protein